MTFVITAELPLGTYRGGGRDGRPEPMPSVARLHSALLCAAGFGPRAVPRGELLEPCEADEVALRWLEEHPPDGVVIPALAVNLTRVTAYRDDGTIKKTRTTATIKKLPKSPDTAVAVDGRFRWMWHEDPPPLVRAALAVLCPDVAYLGTTESPVRLRASTGDVEPTHDLDREAGLFTMDRTEVLAPTPGRVTELVTAHQRDRGARPSVSQDAYGTDEKSQSPIPPWERVEALRYARRGGSSTDVPWEQVILLPLDREIAAEDRVSWAVAAHRALIKIIDAGAPAMVTGVYPAGMRRPPNRLAVHLLDTSMPLAAASARMLAVDSSGAAVASPTPARSILALLVPQGADAADMAVLSDAVSSLTSLRGPGGQLARVTGAATVVPGARLWDEPEPGYLRLWRTTPAAVPDTRGAGGARANDWTFTHAALLSLGFVWRRQLPPVPGRQDEYYRNLASAVTDAGAAVVSARPLRTTDVGRYAHRVHKHAVVRPYTADLWLGDLAGPTTVAAIGQARHLGGGLLVPHDVEVDEPGDASPGVPPSEGIAPHKPRGGRR